MVSAAPSQLAIRDLDRDMAWRREVESRLLPWRAAMGADHDRYVSHVLRVLHFSQALAPADFAAHEHGVVAAAAFHDLGLWSHVTLDYLEPSARLCLEDTASPDGAGEQALITALIQNHHKLLPYRGPDRELVEAFRKADLADLSLGLMRGGIGRRLVRAVRQRLPGLGFHRMLGRRFAGWAARHPTRPAPMLKW